MKKTFLVLYGITILSAYAEDSMNTQKNESAQMINDTMQTIKVGSTYKHYSGKLYKVIAIARDSEDITLERVVYQGLYDCPTFGKDPIWVRPYAMFAEYVVIDGIKQPRFQEVLV